MNFDIVIGILLTLITGILAFFLIRETKKRIFQEVAFKSLLKIQSVFLSTLDFEQVVKQITNIILTDLNYMRRGYVIVVLALVDEKNQTLRRIGMSETKEAEAFFKIYPHPFRGIEIPLNEKKNIGIKVLQEQKILVTTNIAELLHPVVNPNLVSDLQKKVGLRTSVVFPISSKNKKLGILIFSMKKEAHDITEVEWDVMKNYVNAVGIAIDNAILFKTLDLTSRALQLANEKLKELDKLKDDFVSVASHELRTPMTAIKSYLWMGLNRPDTPLSEKMHKYLSRAYISTERLINLVNDMLNVSRIESGRVEIKPKVFDLTALVKEVVLEIAPKLQEKMIKVEIVPAQVPTVFADPDKVHQVLLNLLGNALKFTPMDGQISINFFSDGKVVETAIKDNGVGIEKDDLSRLFQKFGRLDNSYVAAAASGGTGLGLYISKSLIDLMKGRIWATSEGIGKGSTFIFALPAATPDTLSKVEQYTRRAVGEAKILEPVAI